MEYNMWYIWCIEDKYVEYIHRALKGSSEHSSGEAGVR